MTSLTWQYQYQFTYVTVLFTASKSQFLRWALPQIGKLRTWGFGFRICESISCRKHLRICGKKVEIYRKSVNQQHCWQRWSPRGHIFKSLASKPQVLGLGLEALGPRKLPCPRLEDSTIFWIVEILLEYARNLMENLLILFLFSAIGA